MERQWWNYEGSEQETKDIEYSRQLCAGYTTLVDIRNSLAAQRRGQRKRPDQFESYEKGCIEYETKRLKAAQEVHELELLYQDNGIFKGEAI